MLTVGFGVPQGSILGPVIFNLYVSDLSEQVKYSKTLQYADDTKIYIHSKPMSLKQKVSSSHGISKTSVRFKSCLQQKENESNAFLQKPTI